MVCFRKIVGGCINVNFNFYLLDYEGFLELKINSYIFIFFSGFYVFFLFSEGSRCVFNIGLVVFYVLFVLVFICVSSKMSFEVGIFEVGFSVVCEVVNIVFFSGKVYLRGIVLIGGNEYWSRGKG